MGEISAVISDIMLVTKANGLFWPIVVIWSAIFALILWLILRNARLWYWRVDKQVNALENIDQKLRKIEQGLKTREEEPARAEPLPDDPFAAVQIKKREPEKKEPSHRGKTGKIYTEAELEALIRE